MHDTTDLDRFSSRRSVAYASRGLVATSQPLAAEAGVATLRDGGNAFDAAVATAAALNVVEPTLTGLGGDVFALYRTADGEVGGMRSCGPAPEAATIDAVRESVAGPEDDPERIEMPFRGAHSVTVPGTARGWEATIDRFGTGSLAEALGPAIGYATEGYPVSPVIAEHWQAAEDLFTHDHAREAFLLDDQAPKAGEVIALPNLGQTMERIAEEGADVLYEGPIGEAIVEEIRERGGLMTTDDLANFEPEFIDPVSTTYAGAEIYELGPNNQGLIALEALNIAETLDAGAHPLGSADSIHYFAESMKRAFRDGHHYITDPEFESIPPLESKAYATERAGTISDRATPPEEVEIGMPESGAENADTVLLCVADEAGNVVSYINSRFAGFGSGLVAGDTGIALQNRGASFSLDSDHPNRIEPGKRPFHTLMPGLAKLGEDDWLAFGVMGGYMQPQGHLQTIANLLDHDLSLQGALDYPRWRYREAGDLAVEPRFDSEVLTALSRRGHDVTVVPPGAFGGAQMVRAREGVLSGATEPRKDGVAIGY
jgi:gamma-glutamyltranspeptidase / glutathione hydrolase